jgi:hypothetical protein
MASTVRIEIVDGASRGKEFVFDQHDTFIIGRLPDCHVCITDDNRVSRHHCILEVNPPDVRICDLGSRNGTHINAQKYGGRAQDETPQEGAHHAYDEVDLHDGDEIRVGRTIMQVHIEMPPEVEVVYCQRCGRDVSDEMSTGRQGKYICQQCRKQVKQDPAELLLAILQKARQAAVASHSLNIPDYDIERKLGEGGMGAVYLVRHKRDGQLFALKVMLSQIAVNERARQAFSREIENTGLLRHPHIVKFIDQGSTGSVFYFLLEYCNGGSVDGLMRKFGGVLPLTEATPIMLESLEGLAFAHKEGFVHRDLKPANILLSDSNGKRVAKIADLGMLKSFGEAGLSGMTVTGQAGGTYPYMPREQLLDYKYVVPVSDVWAMGATFYHMLTGQFCRDFQRGRNPQQVVLQGKIIPIRRRDARIPKTVAAVIDKALSDSKAARYQDANELLHALEQAL